MSVREDYRRARSQAEKADRRKSIIDAADRLFRAARPDDVTMNDVAAEVGIAKGTLYSYFKTKEELLLVIYLNVFSAFGARLKQNIKPGMSDEAFCRQLYNAAQADPRVLSMGSILTTVIERNVPPQAFVDGKRQLHENSAEIASILEPVLGLKPGQGAVAFSALALLVMGASQHDISPHVDMKKLPPDVAAVINTSKAEDVFLGTAPIFLKGLRAS